MPLLVTAMVPAAGLIPLVSGTSLLFLALLGANRLVKVDFLVDAHSDTSGHATHGHGVGAWASRSGCYNPAPSFQPVRSSVVGMVALCVWSMGCRFYCLGSAARSMGV
jgi:hypothetical protein